MWKDIIGWEGLYEIDLYGNVRNKLTNRIKTWDINSAGYARVILYSKSHTPNTERFFIHRLVAITFINNFENKPEVNHKDNNPLNNYVGNLEWVTRIENETHSRKFGNKNNVYKPFKVEFSNVYGIKIFYTKKELADLLGVTPSCVKQWLHKQTTGYLKYNILSIEYI